MKILLTGGTGFVGRQLGILLTQKGHDIHCLCRDPMKESKTNTYPAKYYKWDGTKELPPEEALKDIDAVIHLAGENIAAKRWTEQHKKQLIDSRVQSTQNIFDALKKYQTQPSVFIGASAVGFYGDRGDTTLNENSEKGAGFLSDLCEQWENSSQNAHELKIRRCILRFGLVVSEQGGILDETIQLSHRGVLGKLSLSGKQWMSWISLNDLCHLICWCLENQTSQGVYNAVSANPVQNKDFVQQINSALKNLLFLPVPSYILKLVLGERSTLLLSSQRVEPSRATSEGFEFHDNSFSEVLSRTFPNWISGQYLFHTRLWLKEEQKKVFNFFKDENNLERITPSNLNFKILSKSTENIQKNTLIKYKLKVHGINFKWSTKIKDFDEPQSFTDIQLKGPYKKWEHTHSFSKLSHGTLIDDKVIVKLPFGIFGRIFAFVFVLKDIKRIFKYRAETISSIYQKKSL